MKKLTKIPKTYFPELIKDINDFFIKMDEKELITPNNEYFNIKKWYEIYESLIKLFKKYYIINDFDNYDMENQNYEFRYGGTGFCKLINKYKDIYIKDVYELYIVSAYPQKINKLFLEGMQSDDNYLPYIFNIMYSYIKKQNKDSFINHFINYTYGILIMTKERHEKFPYLPKVDKDIIENVSQYYKNIMSLIDEELYYYIDTDSIYLHKNNIDKVSKILDDNGIVHEIDGCNNYLFLNKKKYLAINTHTLTHTIKTKGLKIKN
jgi:hypothetical protein